MQYTTVPTALAMLRHQFPFDHWSQATLGPVSSWMGVPHSSAIGCGSRAVLGEAQNYWVHTDTITCKNYCHGLQLILELDMECMVFISSKKDPVELKQFNFSFNARHIPAALAMLRYQFPFDHWSQATLGLVSSWMGDPHLSAIGCCSRAARAKYRHANKQ